MQSLLEMASAGSMWVRCGPKLLLSWVGDPVIGSGCCEGLCWYNKWLGSTPLWVGAAFDIGAFSVRCGAMCGMRLPWWGDLCLAMATLVRWSVVW